MNDPHNILEALRGKAMLAPMLETTDIPFRKLCAEFGAVYTLTEMVSASGILKDSRESFRLAAFSQDEQPIVLQLVIADPGDVEPVLRKLLPFKPAQININGGCPNKSICAAGAGADLLDDLPRLGEIVEETVRCSGLPVSVKVRSRGKKKSLTVRDIIRTVQDSGASFVIVHGRTAETSYDKPASWDAITEAKAAATIPVIGNGDIFSAADAREMIAQTGCDSVMVGRGALGSPWIFRDIADGSSGTVRESAPSQDALSAIIVKHIRAIVREYGEFRAIPKMRKHVLWYIRTFREWETVRRDIFRTENAERIIETISAFLSTERSHYSDEEEEYLRFETSFRKRVLFWIEAK